MCACGQTSAVAKCGWLWSGLKAPVALAGVRRSCARLCACRCQNRKMLFDAMARACIASARPIMACYRGKACKTHIEKSFFAVTMTLDKSACCGQIISDPGLHQVHGSGLPTRLAASQAAAGRVGSAAGAAALHASRRRRHKPKRGENRGHSPGQPREGRRPRQMLKLLVKGKPARVNAY